jgi:hypothetical protein
MHDNINEPSDAMLPIAGRPLSNVETTTLLGCPDSNCPCKASTTSFASL